MEMFDMTGIFDMLTIVLSRPHSVWEKPRATHSNLDKDGDA
jgi:hypothetical protein